MFAVKTLVFFAVKDEARFFRPPPNCIVHLTGIGTRAALAAAGNALALDSPPSLVLTCGFAGALNPALHVGSLIFDADDDRLRSALADLSAVQTQIHCHHRVAVTRQEK